MMRGAPWRVAGNGNRGHPSPGAVQAAEQLCLRQEEHAHALVHGAVPECLCEVALAGAAEAGYQCQCGDAHLDVAPGGKIVDHGAVKRGLAGEVETLQGFLGAKICPVQPVVNFFCSRGPSALRKCSNPPAPGSWGWRLS